MGNELAKQLGQPTGAPVPTPKPPTAGNPRPGTGTRPQQAAGNRGTGADPKPGTGTRTGADPEKEKFLELANVTAAPVPETPKKKQQRKPRKKKEEPSTFNADQISALILSTSAILASRPGMEIWALRPEEASQLAAPIASMISKSEAMQNMGEHADAIALVTASLVIFAPRAMVFHDQKKQKKLEQNGGVKLVRTDKKAESRKGNDGTAGTVSPDGAKSVPGILDAIPSTIF